ncbi:MAG: hypothetical protein U0599_04535 [Vicinamibacteria bacterium]
MTSRMLVLPIGLGLTAFVCPPRLRAAEAATPRPPARVYTNEDLDRVRPFRDEVGGRSVPAVVPGEDSSGARGGRRPARDGGSSPRPHDEGWWRTEARRVRERVEALRAQADELRAKIAAAEDERRAYNRSLGSGRARAAQPRGPEPGASARLAGLERRAKSMEDDLLERARREGALPGWLR